MNELRDTSTVAAKVDLTIEPKSKDIQPPQPHGDLSIISPLAPQVKMLLSLDLLDKVSESIYTVSYVGRVLQDGEVLH